ncbi:SAM-dependent methyltransferase [Actinomycetospora sp. NBRC 106378]|uniref:SAM-dependent methyltransferase n=1 Tax=Actinomycetospora sp. NBRC 106378 TaxID=3032208 RepID=UPI0025524B9B|nr:SAM-dependent methyltransferase [Actinomycetospora sp. NBRC 106378]
MSDAMPDTDRPNAARIYDYMLGGAHHFAVDRAAAAQMLERFPDAARAGHANRDFLRRAVEFCCARGIRQFLDLGSGIPTVGNVHEVARRHDPDVRVAYVDIEPVAIAYSREVIGDDPLVTVTRADLRRPQDVLAAPGVAGLLDRSAPVAVLAVASLHYVAPEDGLTAVVAAYRAALVPGSAFVMSHGSDDVDDEDAAAHIRELAEVMRHSATPAYVRTRAELLDALAPFELADPGLVDIRRWRAESDLPDAAVYGAVGLVR